MRRERLGAAAARAARCAVALGRDPVEAAREAIKDRVSADNTMLVVALLNAERVGLVVVDREERKKA